MAAATKRLLPLADGSLDLAVSALALQSVNDLPGALAQIRRALKPDGLFLAALLGGDTLTELRQAFAACGSARAKAAVSPRVAPFADVRELGGLCCSAPVCSRRCRCRPAHGAASATAFDLMRRPARHGRNHCAGRAARVRR